MQNARLVAAVLLPAPLVHEGVGGLGARDQGFVVYTAEALFLSPSLPCHSGCDSQGLLQLVNLTCHQTPEVETCAAHSGRVLCFTRGSPYFFKPAHVSFSLC